MFNYTSVDNALTQTNAEHQQIKTLKDKSRPQVHSSKESLKDDIDTYWRICGPHHLSDIYETTGRIINVFILLKTKRQIIQFNSILRKNLFGNVLSSNDFIAWLCRSTHPFLTFLVSINGRLGRFWPNLLLCNPR